LKTAKNILSSSFITELKVSTTGYLSPDEFDSLITAFEDELQNFYFPIGAESNFRRMLFALYDKISFLNDCLRYPHYIQIILTIAVNSYYLTDIIIRNPELLYWLISPENLRTKLSELSLNSHIRKSLSKFKTLNAKINLLRLIKRREILRIGVNDILGNLNLKEATEQLSILAKAINSELFSICYAEVLNKYGIKIKTARYCLVALGKLGGNELNYSSDADFILFFDKNTSLNTSPPKEYFEILNEATLLFIRLSTAVTDKGYIYRVDFRLRPDGRNSPLCRTLKDSIQYYETRGEDWERQMLIKMSFVTGSRKLYSAFYDYVRHFIFPASFSVSPMEQIARMKSNIEKNMTGTGNVKLFSGGIRDIEFSIQALQLLNGGQLKDIRTGNSLDAIEKLVSHNLLSNDEATVFISAYHFFRKIEHYLQLMNDLQTHDLPQDEESFYKLARFMGFNTSQAFRNKIESVRKLVRTVFNSITGQREEKKVFSFSEMQFIDVKKSLSNYKYLQTGQGLLEQKQFDKLTITAFQEIESRLVSFLTHSIAPDNVLDNFVRIIRTRSMPSIWYHEFRDNTFFDSFLKICELSQRAVDLIIIDKSLSDLLLGRKVFISDEDDYLSAGFQQLIFTLSVQFSLGFINQEIISKTLSNYISDKIRLICGRFALPYNYCIMGMGSFSSGEMTFTSDCDIIIVTLSTDKSGEMQQQFRSLMEAIELAVKPFEVDSRLRPEGSSGQLAWDIISYEEYLNNRAQTWELQALTKINLVYGDQELFNTLTDKIRERISRIQKEGLRADIIGMRKKIEKQILSSPQSNFGNFFNIKKSRGGIIDIEFALQFLLLSNSDSYARYRGKSANIIIDSLLNISDKLHSFGMLKNNYAFLKSLEFKIQIILNINSPILPLDDARRQLLAKASGFKDLKQFESELYSIIRLNKEFYESVIR